LLKNQRRAFLQEEAVIRPPSAAVVVESERRTLALALVVAAEAKFGTMIKLLEDRVRVFDKLHM
jgi:hypothetical protein